MAIVIYDLSTSLLFSPSHKHSLHELSNELFQNSINDAATAVVKVTAV